MIDELGALDYQSQLENLVVRGRKRGLGVVQLLSGGLRGIEHAQKGDRVKKDEET